MIQPALQITLYDVTARAQYSNIIYYHEVFGEIFLKIKYVLK